MQVGLHTRDISHTLGTSVDKQCALPGDSPWCSAPSWSTGGINMLEAVSLLVFFPGWGSDRRNDPRDHLQQRASTDDRTQTRRWAGELTACRYCSGILGTSLARDVQALLCSTASYRRHSGLQTVSHVFLRRRHRLLTSLRTAVVMARNRSVVTMVGHYVVL
jgi:hypothetical protein